ncbi:MAG TPA: hypothetical protein VJ866_24410 [Pyrinomonadaceae bacterium]|nr:hypothetical protein [Pyrinomonadaceae bacterium]
MAPLSLLCLLVFAGGTARTSAQVRAPGGKELKKTEALLSNLRRLEEAADAPGSLQKTAAKLYPGLYAKVSGLRDGDLKTDIATAVALYESALRASYEAVPRAEVEGEGGAPDCAREMREAYVRLCREASGRAALLRAKARLHARWAGVELLYARGDRTDATLEAVSAIRAERATDRALAEEALHVLEELAAEARDDERAEGRSVNFRDRLEQLERILASLPRDRARGLLGEARDAFRDRLYWQMKAAPARARVVDANSFAEPGVLPRLGLTADDADAAARANLRAALKFIRKAKEEIGPR